MVTLKPFRQYLYLMNTLISLSTVKEGVSFISQLITRKNDHSLSDVKNISLFFSKTCGGN